MTDTKIQRLLAVASWLEATGWTNMATNVREAVYELQRLGKIEAAARVWLLACNPDDDVAAERLLVKELRDNPCPTK